jgi:zinc transporter ZupT
VVGLLWALHNRIESIEGAVVLRSAARSAVGAVAAALVMLGGLTLVATWLPALLQGGISRLLVTVVLGAAGAAIFLLVASALHSPEIGLLRNLMRRRNRRPA